MPLVPYVSLNNGIAFSAGAAGETRLSSILDFPTSVGKAILTIYFPVGAARANLTLRKFGDTVAPIFVPSDTTVTSQIGTFANVDSDVVLEYDAAIDVIVSWLGVHE